jgi:HK97 gp10 family phage protein
VIIRMEGMEETLAALTKLGEEGKSQAVRAVSATAQKIRADAIKDIQRGRKTGIVYERAAGNNLSQVHRASAPGESPATDTGALVSSIKAWEKGLTAEIGTEIKYGAALEFGTQRIKPRPFMRPALESNRDFFARQLQAAMDRLKL